MLFAKRMYSEWNNSFTEQSIVHENSVNVLLYTVRCLPSIEQSIVYKNCVNVLICTVHCSQSIFARTYSPLGAPLCSSKRPLRRCKSCKQLNSEKPVHKTQRTPTIHLSLYILISSFHPCFVVVCEQCTAGFTLSNNFIRFNVVSPCFTLFRLVLTSINLVASRFVSSRLSDGVQIVHIDNR